MTAGTGNEAIKFVKKIYCPESVYLRLWFSHEPTCAVGTQYENTNEHTH